MLYELCPSRPEVGSAKRNERTVNIGSRAEACGAELTIEEEKDRLGNKSTGTGRVVSTRGNTVVRRSDDKGRTRRRW